MIAILGCKDENVVFTRNDKPHYLHVLQRTNPCNVPLVVALQSTQSYLSATVSSYFVSDEYDRQKVTNRRGHKVWQANCD